MRKQRFIVLKEGTTYKPSALMTRADEMGFKRANNFELEQGDSLFIVELTDIGEYKQNK